MTLIDPNFHGTLQEIAQVPLPAQTKSYYPVGHKQLRDVVVDRFESSGREISGEGYHLKNDGNVMLGMIVLKARSERETLSPLTVMLRNSYDKSHSVGIASGPSVFYCLNMCISGSDMTFLRKHTRNVWRDMDNVLDRVLSTAQERYESRLDQIDRLADLPISDTAGYEILGTLAGNDILKPRMFNSAMREWKDPRFEAFKPRNAWSLYNAVTWGIKCGSPVHVTSKNPLAHSYFASMVDDN